MALREQPRPLFLLSDFGVDGFYAGVMRAAVLAEDPEARVHDLTHGVAPGAVREAGYLLEAAWDHLPADAVVVLVVDPGVGTERRVLRIDVGERTVIGPDNGWATGLLARPGARARVVDARDRLADAAPTFHGRDVFAPLAGLLARDDEALICSAIDDPVTIGGWSPVVDGDGFLGEVVQVDRFGNLVTNLGHELLGGDPARWAIRVASMTLPIRRTFADVASGSLLAYPGSGGCLEIAVRDGRADEDLRSGLTDPVRLVPRG